MVRTRVVRSSPDYADPVSGQFHLDSATYLGMIRAEIARYDELQQLLAEATRGTAAGTILDLGSGTGETAAAVLACHPGATLLGIDSSPDMLNIARARMLAATFQVGRIEDPLPPGPFDIVVSAFAIHHLDGPAKADLFRRVARALAPAGSFAILDVVVPERHATGSIRLEEGVDRPSTIADQLEWLAEAGLRGDLVLRDGDIAILRAAHS